MGQLMDLQTTGINSHHNIDAERSVIGSVLINNDVIDDVVKIIKPRDFFLETHQLLWKAILHQYERNLPSDYITIAHLLAKYNRANDISPTYLIELTESVPSTAHVKQYAQIIKSNALRRRAIEAANRITKITSEGIDDDENFIQNIEKIIQNIRPGDNDDIKHVSEIRKPYMQYLRQKDDFIFTGFKAFDEWMGGLGRGWLYILAGRPSIGKTAKMLQMAIGIAKQDVGEVLIFSQEMKKEQLLNRMISPMTAIHSNRIRRKQLNENEFRKIEEAYDHLEKLPLYIEDAKNKTIEEIKATARVIKRKYGRLGAIIVDYLTIMKIIQEKGELRAQAVGKVTKAAKQIALELDVPFIMLAQLNRESKKDKEPGLEHLKESGDIEQDADVVEFLWHDPEETHPNGIVVQSIIAKGRDIGTNRFKYLFQGWIQRFEELK